MNRANAGDSLVWPPGKRSAWSQTILELLEASEWRVEVMEEILADYSFLEPEDILAAIAYASRLTDHVVLTSN